MTENDALEALREATATIRGYIYQFDASILAVLAASNGQEVTVEGVEDFDVLSKETDTYGQVKYYEAQKLTDSTLRDAIVPMIEGFLRYQAEERNRKRYILYGHFKQAPEDVPVILLGDLQRILIQRPYKVDDATGEKARTVVNLQTKLGATDQDLVAFCNQFTVVLSEPFDQHRLRLIAELGTALGVTKIEAESFSYPSALSAMAGLSSARAKLDRTTTRKAFLQHIRPKMALYSAWALRMEGEIAYCRKIRELHFARLNIDSHDRFFVISLPDTDGIEDLHGLVQHIISRWSSHKINSKPDRERYAPIFFLPGLDPPVLAQLKLRLVDDSHKISDGYAFNGAPFTTEHLMLAQTRQYPVSARFVMDHDQFNAALAASKRGRLVIQLHTGEPHSIDPAIQQITVPINAASMAKKII
jgi:hypothetical protein